jgi:predicted YcjX-like family ATPase
MDTERIVCPHIHASVPRHTEHAASLVHMYIRNNKHHLLGQIYIYRTSRLTHVELIKMKASCCVKRFTYSKLIAPQYWVMTKITRVILVKY